MLGLMQVKADWIKPGAAVIDIGINAVDDASKKAGYRCSRGRGLRRVQGSGGVDYACSRGWDP